MSKRAPDHNEGFDDSSLDEYGVWVKSAAEESVVEPAELVPENMEDAVFVDGPDVSPVPGSIHKEQEVPEMSENNKTNDASPSDELELDQDLTLDASVDIDIPGDDDLGGLSDLLLNIDEEQDSEDTIYLEDDDLSLDLDTSEDLELDSDVVLGGDDEGYDEDITIPGLDDFSLEGESADSEGIDDSLAQLNEESISVPDVDSPEAEEAAPPAPSLEMHDIEEVGLDEFLADESDAEAGIGLEDDELSLPGSDSLAEDSLPVGLDLDEEIVLEDMVSQSDEGFDSDIQLDIEENIPLDNESFAPESGMADTLPGAVEEEMDAVSDIPQPKDEPNLPDLEEEMMTGSFDDVAAVTEEFTTPSEKSEAAPPPSRQETPLAAAPSAESVTVLKSIEDELHAIRSELTDLRSELRRLRDKGISAETAETVAGIADRTGEALDGLEGQAEEAAAGDKPTAGGFFDDDEDETIALTGDELDNILNSAEFTEEAGEPSNPDLDEMDETEMTIGEPTGDSGTADSAPSFEEDPGAARAGFEDSAGDDFPPIEEINLQEIEGEELSPDEDITIEDDDFTTGSELTDGGDLLDDSVVAAEVVEDPFSGSQQAVEQMASMDIDNVLAGIEELKDSEEDIELFTGDEIESMELELPEEIISSDPIIEAEAHAPVPIAEPQPQVVKAQAPAAPAETGLSGDLKQEIKAVLAYMDQLLESLPEEKIEEFARSEHFEVYKKLFSDLGL
jgi:hypothetical protein